MKNKNTIAAVFAIMAAVSGLGLGLAHAEDIKIDFDGKKSSGFFNVGEIKADIDGKKGPADFQAPAAAAVPARNGKSSEITIKAIMKNGEKTKEETLVCRPGLGADKISDCRKSDSALLSYEEVNTLSLRQYFSPGTLKFADMLNQTKHSYTNQSGPMTFKCDDTCGNYDLVSIGFSLTPPYLESFEVKCVEWTHECDCIAGC